MVQNGAPEGPRGGLLDTLGGLGGSLGTLGSSLGALWGPGWPFTPILEHFWLHFGRPNGAKKCQKTGMFSMTHFGTIFEGF